MKTNDHLKHDYQAGQHDWDEEVQRIDELDNWGYAFLTGIVFVVLLAVLFLVLALLSPEANAWDRLDNGWPAYPTDTSVTEMDLGGGIRQRNGTIDGERYQSQELDLGGGIRQESGRIGDRNFHCETLDLGTYSTTRCW